MACRKHVDPSIELLNELKQERSKEISEQSDNKDIVGELRFGVDTKTSATDIMQNNVTLFDWVVINKDNPQFWGRNINGEGGLSHEEIKYIHSKSCKVAPIYVSNDKKLTAYQGEICAENAVDKAAELWIPKGTAIFLEVNDEETVMRGFMYGYAVTCLENGFVPGFKVNTDAKYIFDREYSRGLQTERDVFSNCLIWATAPEIEQYHRVTTTHFIHPDEWKPFAPSGITRKDIAVWQYGRECHPIMDDKEKETTFNVNLINNERIIANRMY